MKAVSVALLENTVTSRNVGCGCASCVRLSRLQFELVKPRAKLIHAEDIGHFKCVALHPPNHLRNRFGIALVNVQHSLSRDRPSTILGRCNPIVRFVAANFCL